MRKGNPATALSLANSVVITESMATKYFGTDDPIGKTITNARRLWTTLLAGYWNEIICRLKK